MSYNPYSLFRLLQDIDSNNLLLPHIQRAFVWDDDQIVRLFDSVMRDYPIQTFLFWRTNEEIRARRFMSVIDRDAELSSLYDVNRSAKGVDKRFVLDGQQRLQSLHTIFRGGILTKDGAVSEAYVDITSEIESYHTSELLFELSFSADPLPLPFFRIRDLSETYAMTTPFHIADRINDALGSILTETADAKRHRERAVMRNIQQVYDILHSDRNLWVQELDGVARDYPYRRILDIFVRVNSGGTKLTAGDLMFAAMKEGWDDIEERIEQTVDLLNGGRLALDKNFPLKCLLLSEGEGAEIATEKFLGENGEALLKRMDAHWDRSEQAFQELRDFMELSLRLSSDKVVRSYNALVVIFDFIYHNPQPAEIERQRLAAYYYKAQLFGWFGSQTDSVLNSLHSIVGKPRGGRFPLEEIKDYFSSSRGLATELSRSHLDENRLKSIILNIVYIDRFGASPFNVAFRGNEPHVDHIYPQYMLRSRLSKGSAEINQIGNLRLFGATDNIRKRAELPASYFVRLQAHGVPVGKHLLVPEFGRNPDRLSFDSETFDRFCAARREEIWESLRRVVDPEIMG